MWHEYGHQRVLFESGAILTSLGPLTGQAHHWSTLSKEKPAAALKHHVALVERVYKPLDERLTERRYLADEYSIVDIAAYPWMAVSDWTTLQLSDYPNLARWYYHVSTRPAVTRGMAAP